MAVLAGSGGLKKKKKRQGGEACKWLLDPHPNGTCWAAQNPRLAAVELSSDLKPGRGGNRCEHNAGDKGEAKGTAAEEPAWPLPER